MSNSNETARAADNGANGAATVAAINTLDGYVRYDYKPDALDKAVLAQMGADWRETADGSGILIDDGTLCDLESVAADGAAGACATGFVDYADTAAFAAANRDLIRERIRGQIADGLFSGADDAADPKGVVSAVMTYGGRIRELVAYDPGEVEEAIARVFFGPAEDVTERGESGDLLHVVANALAWGALEDLANALDGSKCD